MLRNTAIFAAASLLVSCVTVGGKPISVGPDTYQLSMTGVGFATQGNTNMKALQSASNFCSAQGLHMMPVHTNQSGVYGFSPRQNDLEFMCLKETDPRYQTPNWRKDNGVTTVESR